MAALATLASDRCSRTDHQFLKAVVDRRLGALLPRPSSTDELANALHYSLLAPGKRIRPILAVLATWELGETGLAALDAGCAIEMVHAASLILDDLPAMDDAMSRRGQPATHIRFGEDVAMLAAITLLSLAFGTIGGMAHLPAEVRCTLVTILTRAVGFDGLAGGQYADLRPGRLSTVDGVAEANRRKTAALFTAAAEMACAINQASSVRGDGLRDCVSELGQAYQILDDLIDHADLEDQAKTTVMSLIGIDGARTRLQNHIDRALSGLRPAGPLASYVRHLFTQNHPAPEPA